MTMQQCPNGHLYDATKNSSCPFCSSGNSLNVTVPLSDPQPAMAPQGFQPPSPIGHTIPLEGGEAGLGYMGATGEITPTMPLEDGFMVTQELSMNDKGIVEVCGWLVCVEGEKRGLDFKICGDKTTIGRGDTNDIKLEFDHAISKGVNAIIAYDSRKNKFFIYGGESKNNIYVNEELLMTPVELKDYDKIEIGSTKLLFRSLCNDQFVWKKDQ